MNDPLFWIHLNVDFQSFVGFGLVPVRSVVMAQHGLYYGFRAVHGMVRIAILMFAHEFISVIPRPRFPEIHFVFFTENFHFIFCKAEIFRQIAWIGHGKLHKHIQRGVGTVFLDRQNPGHVCQRHIILILQPCAEEIEILPLGVGIVGIFAEKAVPFVDEDNKRTVCFGIYTCG